MKDSHRALVIILLVFGGLLALFYFGSDPARMGGAGQGRAAVGELLPDFSLTDLAGSMVRLSDHKGKVVLVHVWATWCPPCVDEMPSMERLYQALPRDRFEILAISIDVSGRKAVEPFVKSRGLTFPALLDPDSTIGMSYGITGVPESFIVDKNGIIARKIIGSIDWVGPDAIEYLKELVDT